MARKVLAAGTLTTTSARLYYVPSGFEAEVYVSYSNTDNSGATTCNCHIDGAAFPKMRRIGKSTALVAAGTIEIPGDGSPICLSEGDEIWGDSAAAVDYIITGREVRK